MADTTYNVLTKYKLDTKEADDGVKGLMSSLSTLKTAAASALALFGIEKGISSLVEMQQQAEDTKIAIAGMLQANGAAGLTNSAEDFNDAMGMSQAILTKMRKDARDLPGEFEDLVNVFRGGIGGGLSAGKSVNEIEGLSARLMAVGATLQMQSEVVGREFSQMLEGRAGAHNTLFMRLKNQIGMTAKEFNVLTDSKKWDLIDKALKGYDPAVKQFASTWSAVSSATTDYGKLLLRIGSDDLFDRLKESLQQVNALFEANQPAIEAFARGVGKKIGDAFDWIVSSAERAWPYVRRFFDALFLGAKLAIAPIVALTSFLWDFFAPLRQFAEYSDVIEIFGMTLGGLLVGYAGVTAAQWAWNTAMAANPIGLLAVGIAAVAASLVVLIANWEDFTDTVSSSFDIKPMRWAMKAMGVIPKGASDADIDDAMNVAPENGRRRRNQALENVYGDSGTVAHVKDLFGIKPGASIGIGASGDKGMMDRMNDLLNKKTVEKKGNTNVSVKIEQTIEDATDPERILIKTKEALDQALIHPIESGYQPFSTMR